MKYLNRLVSFDLGKYTRSYSKHFYTRRCHSYSKQLITEEEVNLQFKRYNAVFKFGHRSVLSVTGEDAESFLQSMITNDMKSLKDNKVALFGLFLNPKGRVLFDAIIVKSHFSDQTYPDYWIDIHEEDKEELLKHLNSHIIRKKVIVQDLSDIMKVHGAVSLLVGSAPGQAEEGMLWKELQDTAEYIPSEEHPEVMVTDSMAFYDPRLRSLGCRVICPENSLQIEEQTINLKIKSEDYEAIRMLYGVPEGPHEVKNTFPLNMNFQHLNGISFNKGCYIGQELTQRTYHTGVIRKIAMPFICTNKLTYLVGDEDSDKFSGHIIIPFQSVEKSFKLDLKDKEIKDGDGDIIGKVFTSSFNCGIAMIDKEKIISSKNPKFKIDDLNTVIIDPNTLWDSVREVEQNS